MLILETWTGLGRTHVASYTLGKKAAVSFDKCVADGKNVTRLFGLSLLADGKLSEFRASNWYTS